MRRLRGVGRIVELGLAAAGVVLIVGLLAYTLWWGESSPPGHDMSQMGGAQGAGTAMSHGDGLSDSHDGFRLVPERLPGKRGPAQPVAFKLLNPSGQPQTDYVRHQTKLLHMIVVRDDMHAFQHVHPRLDGDTWRTRIDVPDGGQYRIFAEFMPESGQPRRHPVLVGAPFVVAGDTTFRPLPAPAGSARAGEYTVRRPDGPAQPIVDRTQTLRFAITDRQGRPAKLETYLDSYAHVTAFNAMTMAATHLHPQQRPGAAVPGELTIQAKFTQRGEHRIFVEFKAGGKVRTAAFTVFVT